MSQSQLLKSRRFFPLFITQFLGAFNDNFLKNALVILITYHNSNILGVSPAQMVALSGAIFILPFFLFSAQAGQLADKFEKTRIIRWVKMTEIAIMAIAAGGFLFHHLELLLFSLFCMGMHSTLFGPVKYSILPQHLSADELVGGNALVEAGTFIAILIGTIAGGVLITRESGPQILSVGLLLVAIVGLATSTAIPKAPPVDPSIKISWNPIPPTWEMMKFTHRTRSVFLSIMGISWFWFLGAIILSIFPPYCKEFLHAEGEVVTLFLSIFSIGIAFGSLLCEKLSRQHLELGLVPLGSIGISLFAIDIFFTGTPAFVIGAAEGSITVARMFQEGQGWRIMLDLFGLSMFSGLFIVPLYTLIQSRSEPSQRSRIIAGNNVINSCFMVVGAIQLFAMMAVKMSFPAIFLTLAIMNIAVATYIYSLLPEFAIRFVIWMIANVMYRLKVTGRDNIPKEGAAILVCNHVSFVDWMIISAGVKRPIRFIMDHSFAKGPMRILMKQAKIIPIAPAKENPELLKEAFRRAAEELADGNLVCIFPEGRITKDGHMNVFKPGIEKMIETSQVPVIPMGILNMWGSFFSRKDGGAMKKPPSRFWSRIGLTIGAPVAPQNVKADKLFVDVARLIGEPEVALTEAERMGSIL